MHFDGSKMRTGLGAGIILTSPKGDKLRYTLQIHFAASNNVAEYEPLIYGLRLGKELALAGFCVTVTPTWWSSSRQATGAPRMQTWKAIVSSYNNSVGILMDASFSMCQETTTSKKMPWHESSPPAKKYRPASPFNASSSRLSSHRQNQILSSC